MGNRIRERLQLLVCVLELRSAIGHTFFELLIQQLDLSRGSFAFCDIGNETAERSDSIGHQGVNGYLHRKLGFVPASRAHFDWPVRHRTLSSLRKTGDSNSVARLGARW